MQIARSHRVLAVHDLEMTSAWYRDVLAATYVWTKAADRIIPHAIKGHPTSIARD
jgi:catechol 2,3-dioxygenase-like lactoylglutathione lyase family enzyme